MNKRISSCTTILVGKKATLDGSTLIARNEDGYNKPNPQKFRVIQPADQPIDYTSALMGSKSNYLQIRYVTLRHPMPMINMAFGLVPALIAPTSR